MPTAEVGALRAVLSLNAGEFVSSLQRAGKHATQFERTMTRVGRTLEHTGKTLSMYVTAPIVAAGVAALNVAKNFEQGMSNVSTLVDTSKESLAGMSGEVLAMGKRVPVALGDLSVALYDIRSAGTSAGDAMGVLEGSARLAVAGLGTTQEAADLVTSSVNAFKLEGKDAQDVYDLIFKTVKNGKTTISGLARGFGAVAGTMATSKIKLDEYLASVAALTTTGLPAAIAHTQLRAAVAGLTRETKQSKKIFQAYGVKAFDELVVKAGGLVQAFKLIYESLGGNKAQLVKLLGSVEAFNAVIGLTGAQNKVFQSTLSDMRGGLNAVDEAFTKQSQTIQATQIRLTNALQTMGIQIGVILTPAAEALARALTRISDGFMTLSPAAQQMVVISGTLAATLGPVAVGLGLAAKALAALGPVIVWVGSLLRALVAGSGPIGLTIAAIAALTTAWITYRGSFQQVMADVDQIARQAFANLGEILSAAAQSIQDYANKMLGIQRSVQTAIAPYEGGLSRLPPTLRELSTLTEGWVTTTEAAAPLLTTALAPVKVQLDQTKTSLAAHNQAMRDAKQIIQEIQTPAEALAAKQEKINRAFRAGALTAEQYGRAMAKATAMNSRNLDALASSVSSNLSTIFGDTKAVAIATALINTYQGITRALSTYPPPISTAMAALQAAAGFAQVANIKKTTSTGGGGGGSSASGAAATTPAAAAAPALQRSLIVQGIGTNQLFTGEAVRSLAEKLIEFQKDGGQVVLA